MPHSAQGLRLGNRRKRKNQRDAWQHYCRSARAFAVNPSRQKARLLRLHLDQIDALQAAMARIDAQVEANLGPFRTAVELIMSIPGIKNLSAQVIVSEIGIDMSRFPSAAHLISWACVCPRNDESAGKRRSNRQRKGATWLKTTLARSRPAP